MLLYLLPVFEIKMLILKAVFAEWQLMPIDYRSGTLEILFDCSIVSEILSKLGQMSKTKYVAS